MLDPSANIIAASPFCFFGYDPFTAYNYLQRTGIRYVEVPAVAPGLAIPFGLTTFAPEMMDQSDVQALRERLAGKGLTPVTVAAFCDLLRPGEVEALRRRIDFAQQLGAGYIISDATSRPEVDQADMRKLINAMRHLADYAADRGVRIALEIHEGPTRNGAVALKFLEAVDHPNVGVNYDTGNIYYYNDSLDPAEDIKQIAQHVTHVHLKDTTGGKGEWKFCALGEGRVNFPAIISVLQSVGFRGPYSLEIEGSEGEDLNREGHLQRVQKSLDYLRQIGLMPPA